MTATRTKYRVQGRLNACDDYPKDQYGAPLPAIAWKIEEGEASTNLADTLWKVAGKRVRITIEEMA